MTTKATRAGNLWSRAEEHIMLQMFDGDKATVADIAARVRRTPAAVVSRLELLNRLVYVVKYDDATSKHVAGYFKIAPTAWCQMGDVRP